MGMTDNIGKLLNMEVSPTSNPQPLTIRNNTEPSEFDPNLDKRYDEEEQRLSAVIETAAEAMHKMYEIATQDEKARSFEVVSILAKTVADISRDYLEISERRRDLRVEAEKKTDEQQATTVNNTLVINGSTSELQKLLRKDIDPTDDS